MPRSARPRWSSSESSPWSRDRFFLSSVACWILRLQRQTQTQARVDPGSALFRYSDGAKNRNGRNKRNHGCEPQARNLNALPDRQRRDRVDADKGDPQQMNDGGKHQRNEQPVATRGRNAQHANAFGFGIGDRQPRPDTERQR